MSIARDIQGGESEETLLHWKRILKGVVMEFRAMDSEVRRPL